MLIAAHPYLLSLSACMQRDEQLRIVTEIDRRLSLVLEVEAQGDANLRRADRLHHAILSRAFSGLLVRHRSTTGAQIMVHQRRA